MPFFNIYNFVFANIKTFCFKSQTISIHVTHLQIFFALFGNYVIKLKFIYQNILLTFRFLCPMFIGSSITILFFNNLNICKFSDMCYTPFNLGSDTSLFFVLSLVTSHLSLCFLLF